MNLLKNFLSLLLAAVTCFFSMPVLAAGTTGTTNVTVPTSLDGHEFTAYQIFSATYAADADSNKLLGDYEWGNGINETGFLNALKNITVDESTGEEVLNSGQTYTAEEVAERISDVTEAYEDSATGLQPAGSIAEEIANAAYQNRSGSGTVLTPGNNTLETGYYLIVDTTTQTNGLPIVNPATLAIFGDEVHIQPKASTMPTITNQINNNGSLENASDESITSVIPFETNVVLPSNIARYESYQMRVDIDLDPGLTPPDKSEITFTYIDPSGNEKNLANTGGYTVSILNGSGTDKSIVSIFLEPDYFVSSTNTDSGNPGTSASNSGTVKIEYSATLNDKANLGVQQSGNVSSATLTYSTNPNVSMEEATTPVSQATILTYQLDLTKISDGTTPEALSGAEFTLQNADGNYASVDSQGKFTGWKDAQDASTIFTSAADGSFSISGIDSGVYTLTETKAPSGYTQLKTPMTLTLDAQIDTSWNGSAASALTAMSLDIDRSASDAAADPTTGIASANIINPKSGILPETGGIGSVLIIAAGLGIAALFYAGYRRRQTKD